MSLLKQLFLAICLFLVVAFTGSFIAGVESSREQLLSQLRSHAQDAATALAASIKAGGSGKWGPVPMPSQPALSEADALTLANWVLAGAK